MQSKTRFLAVAAACLLPLGWCGASEGPVEHRVNCPLWRMMDMGTTAMFMSNEYIVNEDNECVAGPFLSSWYGVLSDNDLPMVCPECDPVAAPATPAPERPAPVARTVSLTKIDTGDEFPGFGGGKKTIGFRPHEQPVGNGGFPEFSSDKLKPKPLETPPRFVKFDLQGETYFAILVDYEIRPRKACKHSERCKLLPKRQDIRIGYEIEHTNDHTFTKIQIDPDWDPDPPQPKLVRVLEADGNPCIVLLAEDETAAGPEVAPVPPRTAPARKTYDR